MFKPLTNLRTTIGCVAFDPSLGNESMRLRKVLLQIGHDEMRENDVRPFGHVESVNYRVRL